MTSQNNLVNGCCFDYGNAETSAHDDGNGTAEAIYFGQGVIWGTGSGPGPWVMADLENGLYAGWENGQDRNISTNVTLGYDYVTAVLVGDTANKNGGKGRFALYGGDATAGTLQTMYDGIRPAKPGYVPMKKEGSIVLSVAGDNSDGDGGRFYEGVMASGAATKQTIDALQANIVAAKYGSGTSSTGGQPATGGATSIGGATATGGTGSCSNGTACGGDVVGTWTVASSCQAATGQLDLTAMGIGCNSAPVTGYRQVTGTFVANGDKTYDDETTTTGTDQITLAPECLSVSGTTITCEGIGMIFTAMGYPAADCTTSATHSGCDCTLIVSQQGSMGVVSVIGPTTSGTYVTSGNGLTTFSDSGVDGTPYYYCASGNTLSIFPALVNPTITGAIVMQKQ